MGVVPTVSEIAAPEGVAHAPSPRQNVVALALAEDLPGHAAAITVRLPD